MTVRIWRLYPNGDLTEQTHVLWPHEDTRTMLPYDDGKRVGYNGDVEAWSNANMSTRPGCCQIVMHPGEDPRWCTTAQPARTPSVQPPTASKRNY